MSDQGVVDQRQLELFSPVRTLSLAGLELIGLLPLTGGELYGSFGSTSRGSLTSLPPPVVVARGFAELHMPELFGSDAWWDSLDEFEFNDYFCLEDLWLEDEEGA